MATATEVKITPEDALAKYEISKRYYAERDRRIDTAWEYYSGQYKINVPDGFEAYIDPKIKGIIDVDTGHIITSNPVVTVPPSKNTKEAERAADVREKFLQVALTRLRRSLTHDPLKRAASHGFKYGVYCFKGPLYDPSLLNQSKKSTNSGNASQFRFPIIVQAINPKRILPEPGALHPRWVFEHYKRKVFTVKRNWIDFRTDKKDDEDVDWVEYWDEFVRFYFADGQCVYKVPNLYGFIPYEIGFAGMGDESADGLPEWESMGIIHPVIPTLRARARSLTALDALLQWVAFPVIASDKPVAGLNIRFIPGQINHLPPELNIRPWYTPTIHPDMYKFLSMLDADLETMTHARSVEGQRDIGVNSGYMQSMMVAQARLRYEELMSNLEHSIANILGKMLMLIENVIEEPLTVYGTFGKGDRNVASIQPKDISGQYYCEVKLSAVDTELQDRKAMLGSKLYKEGLIRRRTAIEDYVGRPNATEEEEGILVDKLLEHPAVAMAQAQEVAKEMGYTDIINNLTKGTPGGGSGPNNVPVQPGGLPSVNELQAELAGTNKQLEGEYGDLQGA